MSEELVIPSGIYEQMAGHAAADARNEVCGILAGYGNNKNLVECIYPGKNADRTAVSYELDPRQQLQIEKELREKGMEMLAIYHSHPGGQAYPSPKDVLLAVWDVVYIIIGLPGDENENAQKTQVRAFRICGETKTVKEVRLKTL